MNKIEEIHNWLIGIRKINRLSYKSLGEVINYSDSGFKKALLAHRLSINQIETIIKHFQLQKDYSEKFGKLELINGINEPEANYQLLAKKDIRELAEVVTDNWDALMGDKLFNARFEAEAGKWVLKLRDQKK